MAFRLATVFVYRRTTGREPSLNRADCAYVITSPEVLTLQREAGPLCSLAASLPAVGRQNKRVGLLPMIANPLVM